MAVLVTGGAGYIGSHAVKRLLDDGKRVVALDNFARGNPGAVKVLGEIGGDRFVFAQGGCGETELVRSLIREHGVDTVLHFAALAYVGESVEQPLRYYEANAGGSLGLLQAVEAEGIERFVFSSTCATYGEPDEVPIRETEKQSPMSPYGMSKLHMEHMLRDYSDACARDGRRFGFAALRYFNVAGADRSGKIGEDHDPETHLIPIVIQAALGKRSHVTVFGTDYPTPDGTCIRDYVHVEDLVDAHVRVLDRLGAGDRRAYNLGIGRGYSVREVIESVRRVTGCEIKVEEGERRAGDPPALFADASKIREELGWEASFRDLDEIVETAWAWHRSHPDGYAG